MRTVNNVMVKAMVVQIHEAGLSAKSIDNYIGLMKRVVASEVDGEGVQMFPRNWNPEILDLPVVEKKN